MPVDYPTFSKEKNSKRKPSLGDTEIESVNIERADNGFSVRVHRRVKPELIHKFETLGYMDAEKTVHESVESMMDQVVSIFG